MLKEHEHDGISVCLVVIYKWSGSLMHTVQFDKFFIDQISDNNNNRRQMQKGVMPIPV